MQYLSQSHPELHNSLVNAISDAEHYKKAFVEGLDTSLHETKMYASKDNLLNKLGIEIENRIYHAGLLDTDYGSIMIDGGSKELENGIGYTVSSNPLWNLPNQTRHNMDFKPVMVDGKIEFRTGETLAEIKKFAKIHPDLAKDFEGVIEHLGKAAPALPAIAALPHIVNKQPISKIELPAYETVVSKKGQAAKEYLERFGVPVTKAPIENYSPLLADEKPIREFTDVSKFLRRTTETSPTHAVTEIPTPKSSSLLGDLGLKPEPTRAEKEAANPLLKKLGLHSAPEAAEIANVAEIAEPALAPVASELSSELSTLEKAAGRISKVPAIELKTMGKAGLVILGASAAVGAIVGAMGRDKKTSHVAQLDENRAMANLAMLGGGQAV